METGRDSIEASSTRQRAAAEADRTDQCDPAGEGLMLTFLEAIAEVAKAGGVRKITRDAFLYLEPKGRNKKAFAQCSTCTLRYKEEQVDFCALTGRVIDLEDGTCALYVEGPMAFEGPIAEMTDEEIGYVERQVRCENCEYGGDECGLYVELNKRLPEMFDLEPKISRYGCCNAQTPKNNIGKMAEDQPRDEKGRFGSTGHSDPTRTPFPMSSRTDVHATIESKIESGVSPKVVTVQPKDFGGFQATQEELKASFWGGEEEEAGGKSLFGGKYDDKPVVLEDYEGRMHIADGHNRIAAAMNAGKAISVYRFYDKRPGMSKASKAYFPGSIRPIVGSPLPAGTLRADAALTGNRLVDMVLAAPILRETINHPVADRSYDVPFGAGGSLPIEDPTTFIDRHAPATVTVGDVTFDIAEPFAIHENVEMFVMETLIRAGMEPEASYKVAHYLFAEAAERAWYTANGIDKDEAETQEDVWLRLIQHEAPENPPPNLYLKPYGHSDIWHARHEQFEESLPTAAETALARDILEATYGAEEIKHMDHDLNEAVVSTLGFLEKHAPDLAQTIREQVSKAQPTAGEVHATTALGNQRRKARDFLTTIGEIKGGAKVVEIPGTVEEDEPDMSDTTDVGKVWASNADLPKGVQGLPDEAKTVFRRVANERMKAGAGEVSAIKQAWTAVKNGWKKEGDTWVRKMAENQPRDDKGRLKKRFRAIKKCPECGAEPGQWHKVGCSGHVLGDHEIARGEKAVDKADDERWWHTPFEVQKVDEDQQLVFGWASISTVDGELIVDKQNDVILPEDLEKAAYDYMLYCQEPDDPIDKRSDAGLGDMHERKGMGRVIESFVFTKQKQDLLGIDIRMEGWWIGFKVDDLGLWKRIKSGELPEFSIGGKARRIEVG
jgi:hypothetical protein